MKNLAFCFAVLLLASCGGGQKKAAVQTQGERVIPEFDLSEPSKAAIGEKLTWNDLAKNIRVIPLETNDASLLGGLCTIKAVTDSYIVLFSQNLIPMGGNYMLDFGDPRNNIIIFGKDGKHELTLQRHGKGGTSSMEYVQITEAIFIEEPFTIRVYDRIQNAFLDYDKNGKGILFTAIEGINPTMIKPVNDDFYLDIVFTTPLTSRNDILTLRRYDNGDSKTLFSVDAPLHEELSSVAGVPMSVIKHEDGMLLYRNTSDTVYKVTGSGMEEFARIKRGKYGYDEKIYSAAGIDEMSDIMGRSIGVSRFIPAGEYHFIEYTLQDIIYKEIWKDGKPIFRQTYQRRRNPDDPVPPTVNLNCTLPNGETFELPVMPGYAYNNKIYFLIEAHKLTDIIPGIKEDDNQVLIEMEF